MTAPALALPAPPAGERSWSVVTLAAYLCVPPAAVDALLQPCPDGGDDESPDIRAVRPHASYDTPDEDDLGDVYLWDDAAERIAAQLNTGLLARRIVSVDDALLLDPDQIVDLARHIVEHLGGPA